MTATTHGRRDGGPGLGRADPGQPGDRRAAARAAAWVPRSDRGVLLARSPHGLRLDAPEEPVAPSDEAIAACLPDDRATPICSSGHAVPEHRTASIAFLQFTRARPGSWPTDGAGAPRRALDELVRLVQDACERYEVCFLDSDIAADGGKIRLSAGAPRVVGDDEERMLLALRQIVEADLPLPVQVGVNRGPVFTGEVGPAYRRWYAVMGDTVNLAARVMGKAPAGHIYATRDVLRQRAGRFRQSEVGPFTVKGKARPVPGLGRRVRRCGRPRIRRSVRELPLIGREHELELLAVGDRGRPARRGSADRARRRDRQRQVAAARRGARARRGHARAPLDLRGRDARDAVLRLARAAASAARGRVGRSRGARAGAARGRDPAPASRT